MRPLILPLLLNLVVFGIQAQSFFVSEFGKDNNPGTQALPFRTIQKALNSVQKGTIYVRGGIYHEKLTWQFSGDVDVPLTLSNFRHEIVVVDGSSTEVDAPLLQIMDKSHVVVQNISFKNNIQPYAKGIFIAGFGVNVQINNCVVENIGWTANAQLRPTRAEHNANGILVLGNKASPYSRILIKNTIVHHCQAGSSEALTVTGNVDNFLLENNWIHNITNIGIDVAGHYSWTLAPDSVNQARNGILRNNRVFACIFPGNEVATAGIYVDGARDIVIERNHCFNNSVGISVGCENNHKTSSGITVRNNFIYHNLDAGLFWGANAKNSRVEGGNLHNNTFFRNAINTGWRGEIALQNSKFLRLFQNIISTRSGKKALIILQGYTLEQPLIWSNLYFNENSDAGDLGFDWGTKGYFSSLTTFQQATGHDLNSFFSDPLFVSETVLDLHLKSGSPSRDQSEYFYVPTKDELDIDGQPRLMGKSTDFGADELPMITNTQLLLTESFGIFPNPTRNELIFHKLPENVLKMIILDVSGRLVKTCKILPGETEIRLADLSPGSYFIKVTTRNQTMVRAFMKL